MTVASEEWVQRYQNGSALLRSCVILCAQPGNVPMAKSEKMEVRSAWLIDGYSIIAASSRISSGINRAVTDNSVLHIE